MLTKLHDSKTYSTQFCMYFKLMTTIFPKKKLFDHVKIWSHVDNHPCLHSEYQYYIRFLHSILFRISKSFISQLESCDLVQFWPRYSSKTHVSILFCRDEYLINKCLEYTTNTKTKPPQPQMCFLLSTNLFENALQDVKKFLQSRSSRILNFMTL